MERFKFNCVVNAVVSVCLSIMTLILVRQGPTILNFLVPTVEGFLIAMVLIYLFPFDKWALRWAEKMKISGQLLTVICIAVMNVTVITFILNAQVNGVNASSLQTWGKALPIMYLTAFVAALVSAIIYEKTASSKS